jgi:hypothetical protein
VIEDGDRPVGVLPLVRDRILLMGVPWRILRSITNVHSPKYHFILRTGYEDILGEAICYLKRFSWDMMQLEYVVQGSPLERTFRVEVPRGIRVKQVERLRSPHLRMDCDWQEYWHKRIPKSLRTDVQRLERQAQRKFGIAFETVSGDALCAGDLQETFSIEDSGWKGRKGSSIVRAPEVRDFYHDLAFAMNSSGLFELWFLKLGGKRVAFEYCLNYGSTVCTPKIGYEDGYKRYGLGNILRKHVLEQSFSRRCTKYDLLGDSDPYKLRWMNDLDVLLSLYLFNWRARSRLMEFLMFGGPELAGKLGLKKRLKKLQTRLGGTAKERIS